MKFIVFIILFSFAVSAETLTEKYDLRITQKENIVIMDFDKKSNPLIPVWIWDKNKKIYTDKSNIEETLYLFFKHADSAIIDLWVYREHRSAYSGYLDDSYLTVNKSGGINYFSDSGFASWEIKYFAEFAGNEIPKYYIRKGEGSIIDVSFESSENKISLKRNIITHNNDDINFSDLGKISISISKKLPKKVSELIFIKLENFRF